MGWADARREAVRLLDMVKLPTPAEKAHAYPHELSGGQRQRVMIAMALANRPDLIVADEPTTALDVTTQRRVLELLDELRREHDAALLFISHDFGVIADLCDRVQVMYAGEVVERAPATELFRNPSHPYTRRLLDCVPSLADDRAIEAIPGLPPAVDRLPPGCPFADRCDEAEAACRQGTIALRHVSDLHAARCIHAPGSGRGIMTEAPLIEAKAVTKRFPGRRAFPWQKAPVLEAVKNVSVSVPRGISLGIVGGVRLRQVHARTHAGRADQGQRRHDRHRWPAAFGPATVRSTGWRASAFRWCFRTRWGPSTRARPFAS